jgi:hypothetical protein
VFYRRHMVTKTVDFALPCLASIDPSLPKRLFINCLSMIGM